MMLLTEKTCPWPPDPEYGYIEKTTNTVGSKITYKCSKGYRVVDGHLRFCMLSETWSGQEGRCQGKIGE